MRKLLTEERLCELAGIAEADTEELWKTRRDQAKRDRHQAEKGFFGRGDRDPLVTTDVPETESPPDPDATQALSAVDMERLDSEIGDAKLRPVAMDIYQRFVAPEYSEDELERLAHNNDEVANLVNQLFGWFHPASMDSRGKSSYENPGRWAVMVAQQFEKEGKDLIDNAREFNKRIDKLEFESGKNVMEPSRKAQATKLAQSKALDAVLSHARENPKYKDLPPHQHFMGKEFEKYAAQLKRVFPDVYQDVYEKELDAMLS